jgi:hypothetical protein
MLRDYTNKKTLALLGFLGARVNTSGVPNIVGRQLLVERLSARQSIA